MKIEEKEFNQAKEENKHHPSGDKMVGGSFAVSLGIHAAVLLLVGGLVILPGTPLIEHLPTTFFPAPPIPLPEEFPPDPDSSPVDPTEHSDGSPIQNVPSEGDSPNVPQQPMDPGALTSPLGLSAPFSSAASGLDGLSQALAHAQRNSASSGPARNRSNYQFNPIGVRDLLENSLIGKFYDFKQTRSHTALSTDQAKTLREFVASGFSPSKLRDFFSPPTLLYATHIFIPNMPAAEAPKAYDVEKEVKPSNWIVHYRGLVAPPSDGTYRFVGVADDYLLVGMDGKMVLSGSRPDFVKGEEAYIPSDWKPKDAAYPAAVSNNVLVVGDWIEWKANDFRKLDVVVGERPGGSFMAVLLIEQKGRDYKKSDRGYPILPVFRVDGVKIQLGADVQKRDYPEYSSNGPVFRVKHMK